MNVKDIQVQQLLRVTGAGAMHDEVGRVKKINPKKGTVALSFSSKIHWFKADKLEPYYG